MLLVKDLSPSVELDYAALAELRRGLSSVKRYVCLRWTAGKVIQNKAAFKNSFDETAEDIVESNEFRGVR